MNKAPGGLHPPRGPQLGLPVQRPVRKAAQAMNQDSATTPGAVKHNGADSRPFWSYEDIARHTCRSVASVKRDANRRLDCPLRGRHVGGSRRRLFPAVAVESYVSWLINAA